MNSASVIGNLLKQVQRQGDMNVIHHVSRIRLGIHSRLPLSISENVVRSSLYRTLRLFFKLKDLTAPIMSTMWTEMMRSHLGMTIFALNQLWFANGIMRSTPITTPLAYFLFW